MAPRFQITISSGPNPGTVFALDKSEMILGRDLSADLVINDAEVSRKHARLVAQQVGYLLEDLGSTNGTVVNGQRLVAPYLLIGGEVITIGEQISLVCERVQDDPDSTRVSYRQPAPQGARPQVQMPVQSVAEPIYAGQVPASPVEEPVPAPVRRRLPVWLIILLAAFFLFCACGGAVLVYIDANDIWCKVMPFLAGCY